MLSKKLKPILSTVIISAITSILVSAAFLFWFLRIPAQPRFSAPTQTPQQAVSTDPKIAKYETLVNDFLDALRKGKVEAIYNETSPLFRKLTTLDQFKKLMNDYQSAHFIPASRCTLTDYSDPFTTPINDLPGEYTIIQTKCETTEKNQTTGFNVEFTQDKGVLKISYVNAYRIPVTHHIAGGK